MTNYFIAVDDNDECLMHYGVLGMKWGHHIFGGKKIGKGKRRGKKIEAATQPAKPVSVEEARRIASTTSDPREVLKYAHMFNANELGEYTRRLQSMNQLGQMTPKKESTGKKVLKGIAATTAAVGTVATAAKMLGFDTDGALKGVGKFVKDTYSDMGSAMKRGDYDMKKSAAARKAKEALKKKAMSTFDINELDKLKDYLTPEEFAKRIDLLSKYKALTK